MYKNTLGKHASNEALEKYQNYNCVLKKVKRHAKRNYYINKCNEFKRNTKKLWQTINHVVGKAPDKSCSIKYLSIDGCKVHDATKVTNHLNRHFANVGESFAKRIPKSNHNLKYYLSKIRKNENCIFMSPTSSTELKKLIDNLPNKSSSGWDDINNLLLKEIADPIIAPLVDLFNQSINKGEFPECMKLGELVPLHKGKEMYLADNYRPISLLLTLLEKIVYRCVYNFLKGSNQLYDSQYGFRTAHSCKNAVSELIGCILKVLEKRNKWLEFS